MAQVLIRDLQPKVVKGLKARAKRNGRSLEAELRMILEQAATSGLRHNLAVIKSVQAVFAGRRFSDSAKLIREDRRR